MSYPKLTRDEIFLHVFGELEGLPLLESLINAYFEAVGLPLVHQLELQPRDLPVGNAGEKFAVVNVEVQTQNKPAYLKRTLFYWARLYVRQMSRGDDYAALRPVISLNLLEFDLFEGDSWLHHSRLPHTDQLGFIYVELNKLRRFANVPAPLQDAAFWGNFLEEPLQIAPGAPAALATAMRGARARMEKFMALTPQAIAEIRDEIGHLDWLTAKNTFLREGKAEVALAMLNRGMTPVEIGELTGFSPAELEKSPLVPPEALLRNVNLCDPPHKPASW